MKAVVIVVVLALAGCSSPWVRCERHLTPINGARTSQVGAVRRGWAEGRESLKRGDVMPTGTPKASPSKSSAR